MPRVHYIQLIPVVLLAVLSAWHLYAYLTAGAGWGRALHMGGLVSAWALLMTSLFLRNAKHGLASHAESAIAPARDFLAGAACLAMGGIHLVALPSEPIFLKMGFLVLLLALFETAGTANRFMPALSGEPAPVTGDTLKRHLVTQAGMLAMVFVLSAVLLYMSLMVVVGFSETWTVALLTAILLLALAFMTMIRRI